MVSANRFREEEFESRGISGRRRIVPVLFLAASLVAGCSDRVLDVGPVNALMGETTPPDSGSPIRRITGAAETYPNLAVVPPRPTNLPTAAEIESRTRTLEQDREVNQTAAERLRDDPRLIEPLPIPPVPDLRPNATR